jgi:hypothetical protein
MARLVPVTCDLRLAASGKEITAAARGCRARRRAPATQRHNGTELENAGGF